MISLFTITGENVASTTAWIGVLYDGIKPLIFIIVGLSLGLWILARVMAILDERLTARRVAIEEEEELEEEVIGGIIRPYKAHLRKAKREEIKEELIKEA